MYQKFSDGWLKHMDFIILDIICLQIAFILSYYVRNGAWDVYRNTLYSSVSIMLILISVCVSILSENHKNILRRGYLKEFRAVILQAVYVMACEILFLFMIKKSEAFSRTFFLFFAVFYPALMYGGRCLWKKFLIDHGTWFQTERGILILTSEDIAEKVVEHIEKRCVKPAQILGVALVENVSENGYIGNYPIVASGEKDILKYVQNGWVDEIIVKITRESLYPDSLIEKFDEMGVVVHRCLNIGDGGAMNYTVERFWGYTYVTSFVRSATMRQLFLKRLMDICGAIVGLILTGLLTLIIGPMIYIASPGPIFFSQVRIGKSGKRFRIYKFRSMYMDAEERKAALMEKNKMSGFMFKMDADPRIIGSGPDGTRHGLGWLIRKTSIDEFPQFWNVLKGDMSLVGTRPPTVDEWEKYEYHHRARMAAKPGITGLWQVSGRSDITEFEDVVKLDMEYIKNWTIGEDIKIIFQTVAAVIKGSGSM